MQLAVRVALAPADSTRGEAYRVQTGGPATGAVAPAGAAAAAAAVLISAAVWLTVVLGAIVLVGPAALWQVCELQPEDEVCTVRLLHVLPVRVAVTVALTAIPVPNELIPATV